MQNGKESNEGRTEEQQKGEITGCIYNSQHPAFENNSARHDINRMDRKQGIKNNGESGGNFSKRNSKKQQP